VEAVEFAKVTGEALAGLGGVELARRAEADPTVRYRELAPRIAQLGLLELDALEDQEQAVKAAGAVVCPWPLVPILAVPAALRETVDAVYLVDNVPRRLEHLDLVDRAALVQLRSGLAYRITALGELVQAPLDPFGVPASLGEELDLDVSGVVAASIVLGAFWVLGVVESVVDMSARYARDRRQFGRPIVEFGAIQWRLSDMVLARDGLAELAAYTLWLWVEARAGRADLLALRLTTVDSAASVLANGHQIFGAIGLCEEHDLAVLDRHLQPQLRRGGGASTTTQLLADEIAANGFDGIYPVGPRRPVAPAVGL
jgi:hypothetical protein